MALVTPQTHSDQLSSEDRDIRVEDYLNDKLQTAADLDNLDALLENVQDQQILLKKQVWSPIFPFLALSRAHYTVAARGRSDVERHHQKLRNTFR